MKRDFAIVAIFTFFCIHLQAQSLVEKILQRGWSEDGLTLESDEIWLFDGTQKSTRKREKHYKIKSDIYLSQNGIEILNSEGSHKYRYIYLPQTTNHEKLGVVVTTFARDENNVKCSITLTNRNGVLGPQLSVSYAVFGIDKDISYVLIEKDIP